jgi:phytoene/squalene synthetase
MTAADAVALGELQRAETARYDALARATATEVVRRYSTSFALACRLLAPRERHDVRAIYALVRVADEIVDGPWGLQDHQRARLLLDRFEAETLDAVQHGSSANLIAHGFARTARRCGIGRELVEPFFASMRADLDVHEHDDASLRRYVYGSAEVVGLMCLRAFLASQPEAEERYAELAPGARRLGAAFQKVNFLRDLGADEQLRGRRYVPGVQTRRFTEADKTALLDDVQCDLDAAVPAIAGLPRGSRRGVLMAACVFEELARRLRATPAEEVAARRVRVPDLVKARLAVISVVRPLR